MRHSGRHGNTVVMLVMALSMAAGCLDVPSDWPDDPRFPKERHELVPLLEGQFATGIPTGEALEQPIQFPHYTHVTTLNMQCEFCHSEARKSIHAGVPPTQTCMNCHKYVKTERPEIVKLKGYYDRGEPIPWQKVHDLPDYVHFSHKRHVRAGVNCTECHGQVGLQGQPQPVPTYDESGNVSGEDLAVTEVMVRETSLQMGWCLDCHGSHPSIDENYGDAAELRRAELKDCWTCHK